MTFAGGRPGIFGDVGIPGPCMLGGGAYMAPAGG